MNVLNGLASFFAEYRDYLGPWLQILLPAVQTTLEITFGSFLVSICAGLLAVSLRMSKKPILRRTAIVYVELFRSVPTLVILFMVYYGVVPLGLVFDPLPAAVISLGLAAGAHMTEIFRSGIEAIHQGQREAGMAVGLTPLQIFRFVVAPQASRIVLPPSINMLIVLLKDSSLASLISAPEVMLYTKQIISQDFLPLHILLVSGAIYILLGVTLSLISMQCERYFQRGRIDRVSTKNDQR